ncbi:MAG: hypothetical protein ACTSV7_12900 [Candidatus Baldrarchaeia archaeon]
MKQVTRRDSAVTFKPQNGKTTKHILEGEYLKTKTVPTIKHAVFKEE